MSRILKNLDQKRFEKAKAKLAEGGYNPRARQVVYKKFLLEIDDYSRSLLEALDSKINTISKDFLVNGGWAVGKDDIINHETRYVAPDYLTYCLVRRADGYGIQDKEPTSMELEVIRAAEERFLMENEDKLNALHEALLMKDDIIFNRQYTLKHPNKAAYVEELREVLGYNNRKNAFLPNQEEKEITK